ncbi:lysine N(6)-hydroxylase/L-ornithine N(5)-oxygenase family protein [Saccharothrix hoggarensis]|uniref:L-lysine N6-monooxygenase MbtG n=1 Tax=Saccharothrix hoggarensis TaxID=913853 RepID=A0ABW3R2W1_9PSEU
MTTTEEAGPVLDVVGCGFGPSNLALAIALEDAGLSRVTFFERQPRFGWHRDMLLDGATMQVSFLKDLVTMRNPASTYSFVAYLHEVGRLTDFINSKMLHPYRTEFHAYLEWAAAKVRVPVHYGATVEALRVVAVGEADEHVEVVVRTDEGVRTHRARNVVIGAGLAPHLPPGVVPSDRVLHSDGLLGAVEGLRARRPRRLAVIGAGQSAAEVVDFLHREFADAEVCAVFSRYGYSSADDNPFANRIFDPEAVDTFHAAPPRVKDLLLRYHANTNYSVVDAELSTELFRRHYQEKVRGRERLRVVNAARLRDVEEHGQGVRLSVEHLPTGAVDVLDADAAVFATGYRPVDPLALLGDLGGDCKRDADGRVLLERDYRVLTSGATRCGIYVHGGGSEHTHGISAGLLSTTAVRAGEITRSVLDRLA